MEDHIISGQRSRSDARCLEACATRVDIENLSCRRSTPSSMVAAILSEWPLPQETDGTTLRFP